LVNALLNVSRLELGTFAIEPAPTDIVALAKDVADEHKLLILQKKHKFELKFTKNIPKINVDPKLLHMVLENLLSNSVKYTPEKGSIEFEIAIKKDGERVAERRINRDSLLLRITDTGIGISKDQQHMIFSKFFRADNVRETDTEGTGLGLYIVKAIIDSAGGTVWFESKEKKGTTFYVVLPISGMKKKRGVKRLG